MEFKNTKKDFVQIPYSNGAYVDYIVFKENDVKEVPKELENACINAGLKPVKSEQAKTEKVESEKIETNSVKAETKQKKTKTNKS